MATSNGNYTNPSPAVSSSSSSNFNATIPDADSEAATMRMLMANLPSTAFNTSTPDPRLQRARQEMERTNQITPVLKEELRLRILHKRMEKGEPEIETSEASEPKKYELTDEEKIKRERRKAQNREAAKRCREKRKRKQLNEAEASELIREKNQQLAAELRVQQQRYDYLMRFLQDHVSNGNCRLVHCDRSEVQSQAVNAADTEEKLLLHCHLTAQQPQTDADYIPCKRPKTFTSTHTDCVQVVERIDFHTAEADTVTISLPQDSPIAEETHRFAPSLCTLSSEDVSAILSEDIDLNLSDPSSDTSSPLNPTTLFPSFSDHSASTSFTSFSNVCESNSLVTSSFAASEGTSGLGTSLSFSDNDLSTHQASYTFNGTTSSAPSTNDISTVRQPEFSHVDHQCFSSFNSSGHCSNARLLTFCETKNCPLSDNSFSFDSTKISTTSGGNQQAMLLTSTEFKVKTENKETLMNWSTPVSQTTIDTLFALLNSDASINRPLTHINIPKPSLLENSVSLITPNGSPATLSPASVCPDLPHVENLDLLSERMSPLSFSLLNIEQTAQRSWSPHLPAMAMPLSNASSQPEVSAKFMATPVTPVPSTSNTASFKFRTGVRRASTSTSYHGTPSHTAPVQTQYTTQLSSSSSSASSSTLSPPPSVPSPSPSSSHEVPESPSILVGNVNYCDDGRI